MKYFISIILVFILLISACSSNNSGSPASSETDPASAGPGVRVVNEETGEKGESTMTDYNKDLFDENGRPIIAVAGAETGLTDENGRPYKALATPLSVPTGRSATYVIAAADATNQEKSQADLIISDVSDPRVQNLLTAASGGKVLFRGTFQKCQAINLLLPSNIEVELQGSMCISPNLNTNTAFFQNSDQINGNTNIHIHGGIYDCNYLGQTAGEQTFCDFKNVTNYEIDTYIKNYTILDAWLKLSKGHMINRRFYQKVIMFDSCSSVDSWTVSQGTVVNDTDSEMGPCIKLTSILNERAAMDKLLPDNIDAEAYLIDFWLKVEDSSKVLDIVVGGNTPSCSNYYLFGYSQELSDTYKCETIMEDNTWYHVQVPLRYYTSVLGAPAIRVRFLGITSETVSMWIKNMKLVPSNPEYNVSFMFDDGFNYGRALMEQTAIEFNQKCNIGPMGVGCVGQTVNENPYLSVDQIDYLYFVLGWDVFTHAYTHWNTITTEEALAQANESKQFNDSHGWTRASSYLVFPGHDCTCEIIKDTKRVFGAYRNTLQEYVTSINNNPISYVAQMSTTATSFSLSENAKDAFRRHIWVIYYSHYVGSGQMESTLFTDICSFFYERGVSFQTISDVLSNHRP